MAVIHTYENMKNHDWRKSLMFVQMEQIIETWLIDIYLTDCSIRC